MEIVNDTDNSTINGTFSNRYGKVPSPPLYLLVTVTIIMVIIFIVGVVGNIMVIVVIGCSRNMRSVVNSYLLNLCIADLLLLLLCMPAALSELHTKDVWMFGEFMCKMVPFLEITVACSSIFTIIAISIERFRVVCKLLLPSSYTFSRTLLAIVFIWILGLIISLPMTSLAVFKNSVMKDGTPIEVCRLPIKTIWKKWYIIAIQLIMYVVPVLILFALYFKIIRQLRLSSKNAIEFNEGYVCNQERYRMRRQVINIILCIVLVFFLCHLPFRVISLVFTFINQNSLEKLGLERYLNLLYFSRCLLYANHALNPILYNFVSTKFRSEFKFLIFQRSRSSSDRRFRSPGLFKKSQKQRIIFKRREISRKEEVNKSSKKDNDYVSSFSENQRKMERNNFTSYNARDPNAESENSASLLPMKDNIPCRWLDDYVPLDVKNKASAKVQFIMTQEGYVIGITIQRGGKLEDKSAQTYH